MPTIEIFYNLLKDFISKNKFNFIFYNFIIFRSFLNKLSKFKRISQLEITDKQK